MTVGVTPDPSLSRVNWLTGGAAAVTTPVCDEALSDPDTFAILTYHPPIFSGLKSLTLQTPLQASLLRCIAHGVSVFTIHTASDNSVGGVNDFMGSGLLKAAGVETDSEGMIRPGTGKGLRAITEAKNVPDGQEGAGGGRIVDFLEGGGRKLSRSEVVQAVKDRLNLKHRELSAPYLLPPSLSLEIFSLSAARKTLMQIWCCRFFRTSSRSASGVGHHGSARHSNGRDLRGQRRRRPQRRPCRPLPDRRNVARGSGLTPALTPN